MIIRLAKIEDLPAILTIYNEVIANSTNVYFDDPVSLENRLAWFEDKQARGFPMYVAEIDHQVSGFSSYGEFRPYYGYRFTVEHSVHVAAGKRGHGIGGALLQALFEPAKASGKHVMVGVIDSQNEGSIRFHQRFGFVECGRISQVGFKFNRWLDTVLVTKTLTKG